MTCLALHELCLNFGGLRAVDRVSFSIETGAIHGLIGPNGAGKTTVFNCVTGFYRPTSGAIRFRERDITGLRPDQIARLGIARTFQNVQLFRSLSALDNVLVAKHSHMRTGVFAEGLTLATKLGVDVQNLIGVIQASMVRSGVVDYKAPFVLKRDFTPNFPLRLMHKDMHLMMDAARESGTKLPGLEKIDEIYEAASTAGYGDLDYAATIMVLEELAGMKKA